MRRAATLAVLLLAAPLAPALADADPDHVVERGRLVSHDAASGDRVGHAVDVDGERMVVGAPGNADFGVATGSAYVFVRQGTAWVQEAKLTASNPTAGDEFGQAVAIHGDTVIVTAHYDGLSGNGAGTAYVFTRSGSTWSEQTRFSALDTGQGDRFGWSVALDGDTAVIGAINADEQGSTSGSAYVFTGSGSTWSQEAELVPSGGGEFMFFGYDVAVDDDTVLVGSSGNSARAGEVHVFVRSGTTWTEERRFVGSIVDSLYGTAVAVSGDLAAIGDRWAPGGADRHGVVHVYARTGSTWSEELVLSQAGAEEGEEFGRDVALDGELLLAGDQTGDFGTLSGSASLFTRAGGAWPLVERFTPEGLLERDRFGWSVSLSGCILAVGAPRVSVAGSGAAHAFEVFDGNDPGTAFCFGTGCPCGNDDPAAGCVNSTGAGAALTAVGTASVAADDLVLVVSNAPGNNSGLFVLGGAPFAPIVVGDGLICTGGLFRFLPGQVTPTGAFTLQDPVAQAPGDAFPVGSTRRFQAWTRDVLCGPPPAPCPSPCTGGSNLTNGYAVTMTP